MLTKKTELAKPDRSIIRFDYLFTNNAVIRLKVSMKVINFNKFQNNTRNSVIDYKKFKIRQI